MPVTRRPVKATHDGFGGKITPKRKIFIILLLRLNRRHRLTFLLEFHADLSRYKETRVHCTRYKTPTFSPPFCAPLAQGAKILTREI